MSGFCGIVHRDRTPVAPQLVRRLTGTLAFRGPDRQDTWVGEGAALGHALLRTASDVRDEPEPLTFDRRAWIVADARIDARDALIRALRANDRVVPEDSADAALVLHAWHVWGRDCVRHLLGDFSFAVWDAERRELFCAVDHFGVKPFFHACKSGRFVFANTLDAVRAHPDVGTALDEMAVADYLLFEINQDPASTTFADIRRLPPAGYLVLSETGIRAGIYWELPEAEVRYRREDDYVEHFLELFTRSIDDRLGNARVGVSMSGGLDSTAVAATARALLAGRAKPFDLRAHTVVFDRMTGDEERRYAGLTAGALGMPIHFYPGDDVRLYERYEEVAARFPDPFHAPDAALDFDAVTATARHARVLLTGMDGDMLLHESPKPYFRSLWNQRRLGRLAGAIARYAFAERRLVPQRWLRRAAASAAAMARYPAWIEPEFETRYRLRERWELANRCWMQGGGVRPSARQYLLDTSRQRCHFDQYDAGVTRVPLEVRHPFMDVRLVGYCLSLPPVPWCVRKTILRRAMQGALPAAVLSRPKTPLPDWPGAAALSQPESRWIDDFVMEQGLSRYVRRSQIPRATRGGDPLEAWMNLRPLTLSLWLRQALSTTLAPRSVAHETA